MQPRAITEKIIAAHALEGPVGPGEIATVTPDMLNDVSGPLAFDQFAAMGATAPADPDRVVLVADHFAPASDINSATSIKSLRSFARAHGIKRFYEPGRGGIEHALLDELGLVGHGTIVFGADSHTCTPGAFNALGMCRTRAVLSARPASSVVEPAVRWPDQRAWGADAPALSGEESR